MRALVIICGLILGCAPLDRRAPFTSPEYHKAIAQTDKDSANVKTSLGDFQVGWAKEKILSPKFVPLGGFGQREGANSTGVADDCYVRAYSIAVGSDELLLITADILAADKRLSQYVRSQLKPYLDPNAIVFTASHTHSGPGAYIPGLYELAFGKYNQESFDAIARAMIDASLKARDKRKKARVGYAQVEAPGFITNRVEKDGYTDDLVSVLYFEHLETQRASAIWSFAAHPVTKTYENLKLSADYPGTIAQTLEGQELELLGFVSGAVGSMNPKIEGGDDKWLTDPLTKRLRILLKKAQHNSATKGKMSFAATTIDFPPMKYRITRDVMLLPQLTRSIIASPKLLIQAFSIGNYSVLTLPGEISGQLLEPLRRDSNYPTSVWSLNGNYIGYIVPRRVYNLPAPAHEKLFKYETQIMNFLGPWGADYLMNVGARLINAVKESP